MKLTHLFYAPALVLTAFSAAPASAQQTAPAAVEAAAVPAPEPEAEKVKAKPALWKVADEDTTIYLFGTIHFLPSNIDWYTPAIAEAMDASDLIVKELGPETEDPATAQAAVIKHGLLPPDQSLNGLLSESQQAALQQELKALKPELDNLGMSPAVIDRLRPWLVFINLTVAKFAQLGFTSESGVETVIAAKADGKPRIGLETLDQQFGFFASLPEEDQIRLLMETVDAIDEIEGFLPIMVEHWSSGDSEALVELLNQSMEDAELSELLLYKRNANWAEWIDERMDQPGTVFIAVGAGHLGGEKSVQDFLAQRGIATNRVQ